MTRFERTPAPAVHGAIVVSMLGVFLADLNAPLGIAVWVFYFLPVVLSYFGWRPGVPLAVAASTGVLTILGGFLSPPSAYATEVWLNRGFGLGTTAALGLLGLQFITNKLAVRRQEWLQTGHTQVSVTMAGDPQLPELGERVLSCLVPYVEAQAGAIYIEEDGIFRRAATHGISPGASVPDHLAGDDGVAGCAIRDKRVVVLEDVPDGYFTVGSTLGRHRPRHLLVAPLAVDGRVNGVVELGYFHAVDESDLELMARVSESIAVAIRTGQYRARLQVLLEETQRQAEELEVQSEELRVSNEELEEGSRALQESHARLEQQQAELEAVNAQLEEQAQILETQKDDVTRAKAEVDRYAADLRQASQYKSEFLANMSHELRTPLNASLILSRLLADNQEGNLTVEQVKQARTIESAGHDLLALINDVLDLAKVETGHLDVQPQTLELSRLVQQLDETFRVLATQKGLELNVVVSPGAPPAIETDPQRLSQVLKNLLSNAIKFTERGEVRLSVSRATGSRLAFAVQDTGIGIPEDQYQAVFEPFRQADGTVNRKYGGTGLGLSISRELVRLLGGQIDLVSAVGHGSTFTVLLPEAYSPDLVPQYEAGQTVLGSSFPAHQDMDSTPRSTPSVPPSSRIVDDRAHLSGDRRVILIVEDDESFAGILRDLAHELRFHALVATRSDEALILAAQYKPSAVLLDVGLPDHSGLSVLDRLKMDARTRHIPIHIVSCHDYSNMALALGAVGYLQKPVRREQLMEAFENFETRLTQRMRRVLIVEDDAMQRDSIAQLLATSDVETIGAASAAECLERLQANTFDCMVLDLSLPDASGLALLDRLSQEDRYPFPPVIVYTGRELTPDEEQALRKYSKSIIIKGAKSPERLLEEVTLFLHQVVSDLPPRQQAMLEKARSRNAVLEGRHVLIVEDDVRNIFAVTSVLEPHGVVVRIARNGREAVEMVERAERSDAPAIDLVLMDVMMPEMDGLTAIREIRKRRLGRKLPIITLTAKAMRHDQEEALAAGANDYLAKPLDVDKLLSLVRVWMPR